jgi:hypothetical protein
MGNDVTRDKLVYAVQKGTTRKQSLGKWRSHDVSQDGGRFYVVQSKPYAPLPPVTHVNLINNWFEELKAKVPATR